MSYNHYIEFCKDKPATHPQTGDTMPRTIIDLYAFDDRIELWGFGTVDTIRPEGSVTPERIEQAKQVMRAQGFRILNETPHRRTHLPKRAAVACR